MEFGVRVGRFTGNVYNLDCYSLWDWRCKDDVDYLEPDIFAMTQDDLRDLHYLIDRALRDFLP